MTDKIENFEQKIQVASNINDLVDQINKEIQAANKLRIDVHFVQNPKKGHENSVLCFFVGETISY